MRTITTIGLDIAKSVFQVHDAAGQVVIRRQLKRRFVLAFFQKLPPCLIGIEACASAHIGPRAASPRPHGSADATGLCEALREAAQNDATDAEAVCEAVTRPNMRSVATKTPEQQSHVCQIAQKCIFAPWNCVRVFLVALATHKVSSDTWRIGPAGGSPPAGDPPLTDSSFN